MTKHASKKDRRAQIQAAAIRCFASKGYYETTMDDIAASAGLSKGALYWHFKNKRDLFRNLIEHWMAEYAQQMAGMFEGVESSVGQLKVLMRSIRESTAAQPELGRAQLEFYAFATRDDELRPWLRGMYQEYVSFMTEFVREGVQRNEFRPIDPERAARVVMAYLDGAMLHREMFREGTQPVAWFDEMEAMVLTLLEAN